MTCEKLSFYSEVLGSIFFSQIPYEWGIMQNFNFCFCTWHVLLKIMTSSSVRDVINYKISFFSIYVVKNDRILFLLWLNTTTFLYVLYILHPLTTNGNDISIYLLLKQYWVQHWWEYILLKNWFYSVNMYSVYV